MSFDPSWYTQHPDEQKTTVSLDGITLDKFNTIVSKAGLTNQERRDEAVTKAHGYAWQVANPWMKRTTLNLKLVNRWLESKGIEYPTYPDFTAAAEELHSTGLLDCDEAARAQHLDGNGPKTFNGVFTKQTHNSIESLIAQETDAALHTVQTPSDIEEAFESMPTEQALQMLRDGERQHKTEADGKVSQENADSWLTLHPEYRDDSANGKLMLAQLRLNGVIDRPVTIEDYEITQRQLVKAGMVRQNPAVLKKQAAQDVLDRAQQAVKNSAVFDTTTTDAMYELPLDEVRRRANGNYTGVGF